ncbi:hypothetical protein WMF30_16235 [Sorangium sp. So ce134]
MRLFRVRSIGWLGAPLLLAAACNAILGNEEGVYVPGGAGGGAAAGGGGGEGGALLEAYTLTVVSGEGQSGEVGDQLAAPLVVEARDPEGKPAAGLVIRFVATQGGGYFVDPTAPEADERGRAQVRFVLGPAGKNVIEAALAGTTAKATVEATSENPWRLTIHAGQRVGRMFEDGEGADARFVEPRGLSVGGDGKVYIADEFGNAIRRFDPVTRSVTTFAGTLNASGRVEGVGLEARFNGVQSVVPEGPGRLLAGGWSTHTIHRIELDTAKVTFLAGSGTPGTKDDLGTKAQFEYPRGVAVDEAGGRAFVADQYNNTIRQIDLATGEVTTLAGAPDEPGAVDGVGLDARFHHPIDVAFDGSGTLFIADHGNFAIRALSLATRSVTTFAGKLRAQGYADGHATEAARFMGPHYITYDPTRDVLYMSDVHAHAIRRISVDVPEVSTIVGAPPPLVEKGTVDGVGTAARLFFPSGVAVTPSGDALYMTEKSLVMRRVDLATHAVEVVAGTFAVPRNGDAATEAMFDWPLGIAGGPEGSLLVAEYFGSAVRQIDARGAVTTLAGPADGLSGHADGPASDARFRLPYAAVADDTYVYLSEHANTVRRVALSDGATTTIAGLSGEAGSTDGPGDKARFSQPTGLALNPATGELYVADYGNHRIRVVDLEEPWVVGTLAGGSAGAADGIGSAAKFTRPSGLALAGTDLYVADAGNHAIRRIDLATGSVTTLAGALGEAGYRDGPAAEARFQRPFHLQLVGDLLYVADSWNNAIRRIHLPSGTVSTLLGGSEPGFGTGTLPVPIAQPVFLQARETGEVFFTEYGENVILRLGPG